MDSLAYQDLMNTANAYANAIQQAYGNAGNIPNIPPQIAQALGSQGQAYQAWAKQQPELIKAATDQFSNTLGARNMDFGHRAGAIDQYLMAQEQPFSNAIYSAISGMTPVDEWLAQYSEQAPMAQLQQQLAQEQLKNAQAMDPLQQQLSQEQLKRMQLQDPLLQRQISEAMSQSRGSTPAVNPGYAGLAGAGLGGAGTGGSASGGRSGGATPTPPPRQTPSENTEPTPPVTGEGQGVQLSGPFNQSYFDSSTGQWVATTPGQSPPGPQVGLQYPGTLYDPFTGQSTQGTTAGQVSPYNTAVSTPETIQADSGSYSGGYPGQPFNFSVDEGP